MATSRKSASTSASNPPTAKQPKPSPKPAGFPADIDAATATLKEMWSDHQSRTLADYKAIGEWLLTMKAEWPGEFTQHVTAATKKTPQQLRTYMRIAANWSKVKGCKTLSEARDKVSKKKKGKPASTRTETILLSDEQKAGLMLAAAQHGCQILDLSAFLDWLRQSLKVRPKHVQEIGKANARAAETEPVTLPADLIPADPPTARRRAA